MNLYNELYTIDTEEYREWMTAWFDAEMEDMLNEPHWGFEDPEVEVSDDFIPALLWVEEEHY